MNIYGIKMNVKKIKEEGFLGRKKIPYWYENVNIYPVLASSEEDALEKFKQTKQYKNAYTTNVVGWEFKNDNYEEILIKTVSINDFNINELKEKLPADDFILYCSIRLGIEKTIKELLPN